MHVDYVTDFSSRVSIIEICKHWVELSGGDEICGLGGAGGCLFCRALKVSWLTGANVASEHNTHSFSNITICNLHFYSSLQTLVTMQQHLRNSWCQCIYYSGPIGRAERAPTVKRFTWCLIDVVREAFLLLAVMTWWGSTGNPIGVKLSIFHQRGSYWADITYTNPLSTGSEPLWEMNNIWYGVWMHVIALYMSHEQVPHNTVTKTELPVSMSWLC